MMQSSTAVGGGKMWICGRAMVAERFRSPERTRTGDQTISAEVAVLTLTEPRPSLVGQPPLASFAGCPGLNPYHHKVRSDGQGSSRGQPVWTSGALFCERRHGQVASRPRGEPGGGRQAAITARFTSVFMTGASRLSSSTRCGRFAEAMGQPRRRQDRHGEPVAPPSSRAWRISWWRACRRQAGGR